MRPVASNFPVSQGFASMPTAGVAPNPNPSSGAGYYVYLYGDYQPYGHAGTDIACPIGTPVFAMAAGRVLWADWGTNLPGDNSEAGWRSRWYLYKGFPGKVLVIQHSGWIGIYAHLSEFAVRRGDVVHEGQMIAKSGNTGGVAPHLHVEALVDLNYRTGGGLIYGRTNPANYYGSGALGPAGTLTPQEDELSAEDVKAIGKAIDHAFQRTMDELPDLIAKAIWSYANGESRDAYQILRDIPKDTVGFPVTYFKPGTAEPAGTTTIGSAAGNADLQHVASRQAVADAARAIVDSIKTTLGTDAGVAAEAAYEEFLKKLSTINLTINTGDSDG